MKSFTHNQAEAFFLLVNRLHGSQRVQQLYKFNANPCRQCCLCSICILIKQVAPSECLSKLQRSCQGSWPGVSGESNEEAVEKLPRTEVKHDLVYEHGSNAHRAHTQKLGPATMVQSHR